MPDVPKVLVASPVTGDLNYKQHLLQNYFTALSELTFKNTEFFFVENSKRKKVSEIVDFSAFEKTFEIEQVAKLDSLMDEIVWGRNKIREKALTGGFDYLLLIEQDIIPPKNAIEMLLSNKKEICSALYFNIKRSGNRSECVEGYNAMAWNIEKTQEGKIIEKSISFEELFPPRLIKVDGCGLGCALIERKVLEKIKFRHDSQSQTFEEFYFGEDCKKEGFGIFLDSSIICRHYTRRSVENAENL